MTRNDIAILTIRELPVRVIWGPEGRVFAIRKVQRFVNEHPDIIARSKSLLKNVLLKACPVEIGVLSENGLSYTRKSKIQIQKFYQNYTDADIILINTVNYKNAVRNCYYENDKIIELKDVQFLNSFEITFKAEKIRKANLKFNLLFGPGATFTCWENQVFIADAIKSGLQVLLVTEPFALQIEDYFFPNGYSFTRHEGLGAALCNIYDLSYIHQYIDIAVKEMVRKEIEEVFFNDNSTTKFELLLKGAYKYVNSADA